MALVSGVWLLMIFASLLLILGSFGRIWDTAVSLEAAVYGSSTALIRTADGVKKAKEHLSTEEKYYTVSGSSREIVVTYENKTSMPFGNLQWRRRGVLRRKVIRPVTFIQKVQRARRLLETFTE